MEYFDDTDDIDDGITWADPAIRTDYEAALGRFILAFNEADYLLSQVIQAELSKRGHTELGATAAKGTFVQRLEKIEILMSMPTKYSRLSALPVAKLRSLNADRNNLAHGHFDQNPYDGSYRLILAAKIGDYPISRILALAEELAQILFALRTADVSYGFDDITEGGGGDGASQK
jgi:hypothetical protein